MSVSKWRMNVPLQYIGFALTFVRAMAWCALLAIIMRRIDADWLDWAAYWAVAGLNLLCWALYTLLDVDGDGAEGMG